MVEWNRALEISQHWHPSGDKRTPKLHTPSVLYDELIAAAKFLLKDKQVWDILHRYEQVYGIGWLFVVVHGDAICDNYQHLHLCLSLSGVVNVIGGLTDMVPCVQYLKFMIPWLHDKILWYILEKYQDFAQKYTKNAV